MGRLLEPVSDANFVFEAAWHISLSAFVHSQPDIDILYVCCLVFCAAIAYRGISQ